MSIKIHHGPNGSYKTSGALQDDVIPAIKSGRYIITNIRGFTLDRVHEVFPDCPESVDVLNLSLESNDDLQKMRTWFMWAPRGAFLIFDETQILFPKSWKDKDIDQFDFPGGPEAAKAADRPVGWLDAWTRHRHWNWDIVLTTPNIRYIRDDIRLTCEKAYLHANLALLGIKGRYKESMHDAQENRPPMDGSTIVQLKKIKDETFRLYQSTATGIVQDTTAGKNILASPKVLGLLAFLAILLVSLANSEVPAVLGGSPSATADRASSGVSGASAAHPGGAVVPVRPGAVGAGQGAASAARIEHPLSGFELYAKGAVISDSHSRDVLLVEVVRDDRTFVQTGADLRALGYVVTVQTGCVFRLVYRTWSRQIYCRGSTPKAEQDPSRSPAVASAPSPAPSAGIASAVPSSVAAPSKGT